MDSQLCKQSRKAQQTSLHDLLSHAYTLGTTGQLAACTKATRSKSRTLIGNDPTITGIWLQMHVKTFIELRDWIRAHYKLTVVCLGNVSHKASHMEDHMLEV
jgi:hypothetical protein